MTTEVFGRAAEQVEFYQCVLEIPDRVRAEVGAVADGIDCEFVVLSAGFAELIEPTAVMSALPYAARAGASRIALRR